MRQFLDGGRDLDLDGTPPQQAEEGQQGPESFRKRKSIFKSELFFTGTALLTRSPGLN
jgi:hypothetical protein